MKKILFLQHPIPTGRKKSNERNRFYKAKQEEVGKV